MMDLLSLFVCTVTLLVLGGCGLGAVKIVSGDGEEQGDDS
jgi:hypothetical protein